MKRFLIPVLLSLFCFASCRKDQAPDPIPHKPCFAIYGNSISGIYVPGGRHVNDSTNSIDFYIRPDEMENFHTDPIGTEWQLYLSAQSRQVSWGASSLDEFALGIIQKRESKVEQKFKEYVESYQLENKRVAAAFVSAYVRGVPTITANDVFLGQPAGTDLSDYFPECSTRSRRWGPPKRLRIVRTERYASADQRSCPDITITSRRPIRS